MGIDTILKTARFFLFSFVNVHQMNEAYACILFVIDRKEDYFGIFRSGSYSL